jgi:uncharacterized protein (TIGR02271 family)
VLPVIVEELDVHTRWVETGTVRITKRVQEREVLVDEPLWRDEVDITRMPVRVEGDTMIVSLLEVVLVVEKRWWLTEELCIRPQRVETHHPQQVTLRREEARVERLNSPE